MDNFVVNKKKTEVDAYIYDDIGYEITGSEFSTAIRNLPESVNRINVRINSGGGVCVDGLGIWAALKNAKQEIHTYNDGLAASMAGILLMAGDKIHAANYSIMMIHAVSGGSDKSRKAFQDSLIMILSERSKLDKEKITEIMEAETWLNAEQAKNMGFVHEIYEAINDYKISSKLAASLTDKIKKSINKSNINPMEKLKNTLNLDKNVNEDVVNKEVEILVSKNKTLTDEKNAVEKANSELKTKNEELTSEIEKFKAEKEEALKGQIKNLIEKGVEDGKIKEENKDGLIEDFGSNVEMTQRFINSITTASSPADITDEIKKDSKTDDKTTYNGKTFRELEKEDPEALIELRQENRKLFDKMESEEYK